jgi:hypothetical protein
MSEQLRGAEDQVDQLMLNEMWPGDVIKIVTGSDYEAWEYEFTVTETPHRWPVGKLVATSPDGVVSPTIDFELHGAGRWTDRRENPVQTQQRAFTSYFQHIYLKGYMVGKIVGETDRLIFDKPGQEITQISINRPD